MKLVECVPNISEGRNRDRIDEVVSAAAAVEGVTVLDVDPGFDTNRTVITFVGDPDSVAEGAFRLIKRAAELIDMSAHTGAHPRMGATDVCPFIPVEGVTMDDCVKIARKVGKRVGDELGIPIYLYEHAASKPEWKNLAVVRKGEYEGLKDRFEDDYWKPDFGPARFNPGAGATAMSAREFLIAYNINLNTKSKDLANDIAFELREKGRAKRSGNIEPHYFKGEMVRYAEGNWPCGQCDFVGKSYDEVKSHTKDLHDIDLDWVNRDLYDRDLNDLDGKTVKRLGTFRNVKAIGWMIPEYGQAQISINLTNYKITPPHVVLEAAREEAARRGIIVTGSEVVGLIPLQSIMESGRFYLERQGGSTGVPVSDVIRTAVQSMGLEDVAEFDPAKKILGLPDPALDQLVALGVREFTDEVSRDSPAPGGGSIAALAGGLGAALSSMVANLSIGKPEFDEVAGELNNMAGRAQVLKDGLVRSVDTDTQAFDKVMDALRLPKDTPEEKKARSQAIQAGYIAAAEVPLETARMCREVISLAHIAAQKGNPNAVTDAGVAALMANAGVKGAVFNVRINLKSIKDEGFRSELDRECQALWDGAEEETSQVVKLVEERISPSK